MDRDLRDWLRGLAAPPAATAERVERVPLSDAGAAYVARIAADGTLKAVIAEIAASEPELVG